MKQKLIIALGLCLSFSLLWAVQPVDKQTPKKNPNAKVFRATPDNAQALYGIGAYDERIPLGTPIRREFKRNLNRGLVDTLDWGVDGSVNFGFFPGDIMMEVYKAPTELTLYGVGVDVWVWNTDGTTPSLKVEVFRPGYPYNATSGNYGADVLDGDGWVGYAHTSADDSTAYPDTAGGFVWNNFTGSVGVCGATAEVADGAPVMGTKVLPTGFVDVTIQNPGGDDPATGLYFVDYTAYGGASFVKDEYIGVAVTYLESGAGDPSDGTTRIGLLSGDASAIYPYPGTKYYASGCDGTSGEHGWHIRHYNWRFAYAVELTGDIAPTLGDDTGLPTTLSTDDRDFSIDISDVNPSGGTAGVASATFHYQLDSLTNPTVNDIAMTMTAGTAENGTWSCTVPGQPVGTFVYWTVSTVDVGDNSSETFTDSYYIFEPTTGFDLIFNNQDQLYGNLAYSAQLYFYWAALSATGFDIWDASYGNISSELVDEYSTIVEEGGDYNTDAVIGPWFGTGKIYIVSADEWLGSRYGWPADPVDLTDSTDVANEVLGVAKYYPDINYGGSGDQAGISRLKPVAGDEITGELATFLSDKAVMLNYDPDYETGRSNWLDGIDAVAGATVMMTGFDGVLDSASASVPDTAVEYTTGIYYEPTGGGKSAFLTFDAMALNTAPDYFWIGSHEQSGLYMSPLADAYEWATGVHTSVDDEIGLPGTFELKGNYPNPFNPSTNIAYTIDNRSDITVTVFSLLGKEVATIFSGIVAPGTHEVRWNGVDYAGQPVTSGVYLYRIESKTQSLTGKMMLLK